MSVVITTERLVLREFTREDGSFACQLVNTTGWLQHIGDRNVRTPEQGVGYLERVIIPSYRSNGFGFWLLLRKEDSAPIGMCGVCRRDYLEFPDIGYALLPEFEGKGYATEAASATLAYARAQLGFNVICAIVTPSNTSSIRLLERIGLKFRKTILVPMESEELSFFSDE